MSEIPVSLRAEVIARSDNRCEYCQLSQLGQEAAFHIDHVVPKAVGGQTTTNNLALACVSCSLRKGAKQTGVDPNSGDQIPLFNPRTQAWSEHFHWEREKIIPRTPAGRATIAALAMNRPLILAIRHEEMVRGRHPASP